MGGVIRRAVLVAGAVGVLLGSLAGVASAAQTPALGWTPLTLAHTYYYHAINPGETASQVFALTNSGGPTTSAVKITLTGSAAFTKTADSCTGVHLGAGASCTVTVRFAPASYGEIDSAKLAAVSAKTSARVYLRGKATKAATHLATSPSTGGPLGSTVTDTATLSGGDSPSGTITFNLYGPSATANCSTPAVDTEQAPVSGDGSYTTPAGAAPLVTGTYWWTARYSGDTTNKTVATKCGSEPVTLTLASPGITTSQQPATAAAGSVVADQATVTGGFSPTGTVTFSLYGNSSCTGGPLFTDTEALSGGGATSNGYTTTATGTLYWAASYNGDASNNPVSSPCGSEPVTVTLASPGITTSQQPATAVIGSVVADQATVTGGVSPTGTVTFSLYGNSSCTGGPLFTDTEALSGQTATSNGYTTTAAGTLYWAANYNGDASNNPVSSPCGSEPVTVTLASPGITTSQQPATAVIGSVVADQATVTGGVSPTGTVTFSLYGNSSCTGGPLFTDTESLSGGGATSNGYTTTAAGTLYWVASYNGDASNNPVSSPCGSEPVTVTQASPGITTSASAGGQLGATVTDTATLAGGYSPSGTITFNLYGPSATADCSTSAVDTEQVTVSGNGSYTTPAGTAPTLAGTYWWTASYSGDTSNAATATSCGAESVTIQPYLYWATAEGGTIMRSNADGTGVTTLVTGQNEPVGVAVDGSHIYWTVAVAVGGAIMESNLNGTGVTTLVTGQDDPYDVVVTSSHIYWADNDIGTSNGTIMESNLNGTGVTTLASGQDLPFGVAVTSSHLYWTTHSTIVEANLDGTGATTLVTGQNWPYGIALNSSHIYWADLRSGTIMESNLDGTGVTTLVTGQASPQGVEVDSSNIYWADSGSATDTGTVMASNLDGTGVTTLVTGQAFPTGLALSP